jgi:phosphate/sulfate permease
MGTELLFLAVILLAGFAALDLMVGVSNDAVNFLNSSIGSRAAPRYVILAIATLGILVGVTFSSGMMEVARKGIFHPEFFTMPELLTLFLAVMLTDIILLDMFNTFGLPTSTTVSIVFELLGAAVAVATVKIVQAGQGLTALTQYINTDKALVIIGGILLSIVVAFACGALAQLVTRLLFTFDYASRLRRFGALWGGVALTSITYFILVKGSKGASFITSERAEWIANNAVIILLAIFVTSAAILQVFLFFRWNILKPIVLIGTFALAMAFAANDLVNFIGVPMAGYHAYEAAMASDAPLSTTMGALDKKVPAETTFLLLAGAIMAVTLWLSKKSRTVTETELSLGQQEEGVERFESSMLARAVVRMVIVLAETVKSVIPRPVLEMAARRMDTSVYDSPVDGEHRPSFDMLRASVNLMVASAVISYATSYKLPLSTTYVTFMVAMGTSFADRAWGRESAVYRVTGVLTVIGGWFMTALTAFTVSFLFATVIYYLGAIGVALLLGLGVWIIWQNHHRHLARSKSSDIEKIFNLKKVTSIPESIATTSEHTAYLLREIRVSLDAALDGLFRQNHYALGAEKTKVKKIQRWANIIVANIFKAMRLLQQEDGHPAYRYGQTVRRLQKLTDGHRDIVLRAYMHVSNHHKGLLDVQVEELGQVKQRLHEILLNVESTLAREQAVDITSLASQDRELRDLAEQLQQEQMERIRNGSSKTRLNILYYAILGNAVMLSRQSFRLMEIFSESFGDVDEGASNDLE